MRDDGGFNATGPEVKAPESAMLASGGSLSKDALGAIKADISNLGSMASKGQFAVDPEGARKIAKAYDAMHSRLSEMRQKVDDLSRAPQLGSAPYARQVAEFTTKAAKGDPQSFEAVLIALTEICETAAKAYEQAAKNYNEMDESAKQTFDSAKGKL